LKGIVLAGGLGTRFHPITKVVNKHLLDVFDEPVVFFPIRTLIKAGITEIVVVTGDEVDQFKGLLGDGSELGAKISFAYQEDPVGGIADAISKAEEAIGGTSCVVMLGDNIFQSDISPYVQKFSEQAKGAHLILKRVSLEDAHRFGVAEVKDGQITELVEKPTEPRSDLAQTGCYMYDETVFDRIRQLEPSDRGQLEVTDLNKLYLADGQLTYDIISGWWADAGTPASKLKASLLVALEKGVTFHR
jgi:glucose-1-phosphate thymidylyltransferase